VLGQVSAIQSLYFQFRLFRQMQPSQIHLHPILQVHHLDLGQVRHHQNHLLVTLMEIQNMKEFPQIQELQYPEKRLALRHLLRPE
jgi:hypothetical protein